MCESNIVKFAFTRIKSVAVGEAKRLGRGCPCSQLVVGKLQHAVDLSDSYIELSEKLKVVRDLLVLQLGDFDRHVENCVLMS